MAGLSATAHNSHCRCTVRLLIPQLTIYACSLLTSCLAVLLVLPISPPFPLKLFWDWRMAALETRRAVESHLSPGRSSELTVAGSAS